ADQVRQSARCQGARDRFGQRRRAGGAGRTGRSLALRHRHRRGCRRLGHAAAGRAWPRRDSRALSRRHVAAGRRTPLRPDRGQPAALSHGAQRRSRPSAELERRRHQRPRPARSLPRGAGWASGRRWARHHHPQRLRGTPPLARDPRGVRPGAPRGAHHAGLHSRRQALAHDRERARRPGRPHHPSLRTLRLRRDAYRRDRETRGAGLMLSVILSAAKDLMAAGMRSFATLRTTGVVLCVLVAALAPARAETPDAALAELLAQARAKVPAACTQPNVDRLIKILCAKKIRVGTPHYYPLFAPRTGDKREGYEVDVALAIGRMLGVDVDFVRVNAATRIPLLAEDRIDLAIATMGHNTQRDGQARFIRPHYYRSETTVVGPRELPVASMLDLPGRTVCVTVGNGSNAELVSQGARLMLFDEAGVLPDRLKDQTCTLAAQDDSFFAKYFTDDDFNARYFQKFGFAQVPWGMAVARQGSAELARALDLISQVFHRDGLFVDIGRLHSIRLGFLRQQQEVWRTPECNTDAGTTNPRCILPPLNTALQPTSFAPGVTSFENWVEERTGIDLPLPMLKTAPAWSL